MAIEVMARVWAQPRECLDPSEKLVLTIMADRADADGLLWYAVDTIADMTSFTNRAVQKIIERLIVKGFVRKLQRTNRSNYYVIVLDMLPAVDKVKRAKELGPAEFVAQLEDPAEPDLFGTGERGSVTGEPRSSTGERRSVTGESGSPDSLIDPSNDSLTDPIGAGDDFLVHQVVKTWNGLAGEFELLAEITVVSDQRRSAIIRRAEEFAGRFEGTKDERKLKVWEAALTVVKSSRLLTGQKLDWVSSFDWVTKKSNFLKIMEKNYGRGEDAIGSQPTRSSDRSASAAGSAALGVVERARERSRTHASNSR